MARTSVEPSLLALAILASISSNSAIACSRFCI
jgi:hypothetical protein